MSDWREELLKLANRYYDDGDAVERKAADARKEPVRSKSPSSKRARPNHRSWWVSNKHKMRLGLEVCRECRSTDDLVFAHIIARVHGGPTLPDNLTILCETCDRRQGESTWPHLESLASENEYAQLHIDLACFRGWPPEP